MNPYMSFPCYVEMIFTEKQQTVPNPEEEVAQKKNISQKKTEEMKTYGLGVNSASNKC